MLASANAVTEALARREGKVMAVASVTAGMGDTAVLRYNHLLAGTGTPVLSTTKAVTNEMRLGSNIVTSEGTTNIATAQ